MDRKQRFLYEEWLAVIIMWLAAFYIYYIIVFWIQLRENVDF